MLRVAKKMDYEVEQGANINVESIYLTNKCSKDARLEIEFWRTFTFILEVGEDSTNTPYIKVNNFDEENSRVNQKNYTTIKFNEFEGWKVHSCKFKNMVLYVELRR